MPHSRFVPLQMILYFINERPKNETKQNSMPGNEHEGENRLLLS